MLVTEKVIKLANLASKLSQSQKYSDQIEQILIESHFWNYKTEFKTK